MPHSKVPESNQLNRIHVVITILLGVVVVILAILLIQSPRAVVQDLDSDAEAPDDLPSVTRRSEVEEVFSDLGFTAMVFDFRGGILTGTITLGTDSEQQRELDSEIRWQDLQNLAEATGKPLPNKDEMSGRLIVLVDPVDNRDEDSSTSEVGIRPQVRKVTVKYEMQTPDGQGIGTKYQMELPFAGVAASNEWFVEAYADMETTSDGTKTPESTSRYRLIELGWLE